MGIDNSKKYWQALDRGESSNFKRRHTLPPGVFPYQDSYEGFYGLRESYPGLSAVSQPHNRNATIALQGAWNKLHYSNSPNLTFHAGSL